MGPGERCGHRRDACDDNVHPEGPMLHLAHARRPWTREAVAHGLWSGGRGGGTAGRWAEGGMADKTGDLVMAGCYMTDRGSVGASGIAWAVKGGGSGT